MKLTAKCPECGHEFEQDSMYLGIKRTCPECEHVFVFEVKESGEDGRVLTSQEFGDQLPKIACSSCYRISNLSPQYESQDMVPCGFCGAKIPVDFAKQYVKTIEKAEQEATRLYLGGEAHENISTQLVAVGMGEESAKEYVEIFKERVPFIRYDVIYNDSKPDIDAVHAFDCDICSVELQGAAQNVPYYIIWEKIQRGDKSSSRAAAGAAFGLLGVLIHAALTKDDGDGLSAKAEKRGLYYLCETCKKSMKAWFFNCYAGFPVSVGFKLKKMVPEKRVDWV